MWTIRSTCQCLEYRLTACGQHLLRHHATAGAGLGGKGGTGTHAEVFAVATLPEGGMRRIGPVRFRVKDLPPPTAFVAGKSALDHPVKRSELGAAQGVVARMVDTEWDDPWKVQQFELVVQRRGRDPLAVQCPGQCLFGGYEGCPGRRQTGRQGVCGAHQGTPGPGACRCPYL